MKQVGYPIRYWNHMRNIGDSINPNIIECISGLKPFFSMDDQVDHLLAIGSILFMATQKSHIWGTGVMDFRQDLSKIDPKRVHAVRGELTRDLLRKQFPGIQDFPLGDPGVFVTDLPEVKRMSTGAQTIKLAVMPNHRFIAYQYFRELARDEDVRIIDPASDRLTVLRGFMEAECIASQGLHGLIFAEALGKPWCWISHTEDPAWTFKFFDWLSTTIDPVNAPIPFGSPVSMLIERARRCGSAIDREALRAAMPDLSVFVSPMIEIEALRKSAPIVVYMESARPEAVQFEYDEVIKPGTDRDVQIALNKMQAVAADLFMLLLVYDQDFYNDLTRQEMAEMRRILDHGNDVRFVHYLPSEFRTGATHAIIRNSGGKLSIVEHWAEQHRSRGVLLLRNTFNFELDDRGVSVFSP